MNIRSLGLALAAIGSGMPAMVLADTAIMREAISRPTLDRVVVTRPELPHGRIGRFEMLAPETGKPISGDTILTLPNGKQMSAETYYQELNRQESYLNNKGSSLMDSRLELGEVEPAESKVDLLANQKKAFLEGTTRFAKISEDSFRAAMKPLVVDRVILIPPRTVDPKCDSKNVATFNRNWSKYLGDSKFNIGVDASLDVRGSCEVMAAHGVGRARGEAFDHGFDLIRGDITARATDKNGSDLGLKIYLASFRIIDTSSHYNTTLDQNLDQGKSFDQGGSYHFVIGPIPVSVSYGVEGRVGVKYGYHLSPLNASGYAKPYGNTDAYLRGGIVALIAGGCVSGELKLLDVELMAWGRASFEVSSGKPYIYTRALMDYDIAALDGKLSAYVFVYVPAWSIPPWKKKTYSATIADWRGFHLEGTVVDYSNWLALN